ncbi:MAG: gamma-glutamyltransferase [Rubripirellula sp.]
MTRLACLLAILTLNFGNSLADESVHVDQADGGMVVSDSAVASRIGRDMLAKGGNAVDAAIATAFALAVSWPDAGNIGGGGFMLVRPSDGQTPVCVDYRETAPLAMHVTSFVKSDSTYTQKAVGVPGTVRGMQKAHERFGTLSWRDLVMPASRLAAKGVPVDRPLATSLNSILEVDAVRVGETYAELRRVYGKPDGSRWVAGDQLVLPDLSRTLAEIAGQGPDAFYTGAIAEQLVEEMKRGDGLISMEDLRRYQAIVRPAMKGTFRGFTILGAPPPSSGGTCIIEALNILENFDLAKRDRYDPRNIHLIAETCRRVFADRARFLGDPAFTKIPDRLTSKRYAKQIADSIDLGHATPSEQVAPEIELTDESPDTTHFSVVDGDGMAVSNTYTLEATWGSRIVVRGAGFVLNNEMGDFNWFPGITNRAGRIGTAANLVAPGKRMLSSQSPTIVEKNGRLFLVAGSPGGRTIVNTVLGIVLGVTEFQQSAAEAVAAARMHHQWFPDRLDLEDLGEAPHAQVAESLAAMGHLVGNRDAQGSAHSIAVDPQTGVLTGVADYRRGGRPAGLQRKSLARWDFDEPVGTELSNSLHSGSLEANWSNPVAGTVITRGDLLRVRRNAPEPPFEAYVPLDRAESKVTVEVKIDRARFAGVKRNEEVRIGLTNDRGKPEVTARMIFGRNDQDQITLRGEALGGGTAIEPFVLSPTRNLDHPIVLQLELDADSGVYRIRSRNAASDAFVNRGSGKIAPGRMAKFLRLSVLNDFAATDEAVDIDRIELSRPSR